ncbi:MAG: hypothetical protein ACRDNK_12220 [Solirubrobacteraceae bacterium]
MLDPPDAEVDDAGAAADEELEAGAELVAAGAAELVEELEFEPHAAKTSATTTAAPASNPRTDLPVIAISVT